MILIERTKNGSDCGESASRCPEKPNQNGLCFDLERRGSGMTELSAKPEARDMELAPTRSS